MDRRGFLQLGVLLSTAGLLPTAQANLVKQAANSVVVTDNIQFVFDMTVTENRLDIADGILTQTLHLWASRATATIVLADILNATQGEAVQLELVLPPSAFTPGEITSAHNVQVKVKSLRGNSTKVISISISLQNLVRA